jgi:Zn-finger nucleic acid-binding protein
MTPTPGGPRAWKDCPKCKGVGFDAVRLYSRLKMDIMAVKPSNGLCPTCRAHWQGVAEAVAEAVGQECQKCEAMRIRMENRDRV